MVEEAAYWQSMFCQSWHTSWEGQQSMEHRFVKLSDSPVNNYCEAGIHHAVTVLIER